MIKMNNLLLKMNMYSVLRGMCCLVVYDKFVYEDYFEKGRFVMFLNN